MAFDPTQSEWDNLGAQSVSAAGIFTEDGSSGVHAFSQEIQFRVDSQSIGTAATLKARVKGLAKSIIWISCLENSGANSAWFDVSSSGFLLSKGSNVATATIAPAPGVADTFDIKITFNNMPQSNLRFTVGASNADGLNTYTGSAGATPFQMTRAQFFAGTEDQDYVSTTNLLTYPDLETADGSQDLTIDSDRANWPNNSQVDYISGEAAVQQVLPIADFPYDRDAFSVMVVLAMVDETDDVIYHGSAALNDKAFNITIDSKFVRVRLSGDGTTYQKDYIAAVELVALVKILVTITWDGTDLKVYLNDVELTTADSNLTKTVDTAFSGDINDSAEDINLLDGAATRLYEIRVLGYAASAANVATVAGELGLSGLPGEVVEPPPTGGGGNVPATRAEMEDYLQNVHGVNPSDIFYVNNSTGDDANAGTLASPWATIQRASDSLTAGQAVIISGQGGRFYEQVTLQNNGNSGQRIWYVGDPENPALVDASEVFSETWTNQGSNRWRAPYSRTRGGHVDSDYGLYSCNSGYPNCTPINTYSQSHQLIYNDAQMYHRQENADMSGAPSALDEGQCWFEIGNGSVATPEYVWCRLPSDVDPNTVTMRIASDKKYLFDWSPHTWVNGYPGGTFGQKAVGRNHIGLLNMHFRFGSTVVKLSPVTVRGVGWWVEWSSFSHAKHYAMSVHGQDHTIINNMFQYAGQGPHRIEWLHQDGGTETLFELNRYQYNNFQDCPDNWEAGTKFSACMQFGTVIFRRNWWYKDNGPALWWDIVNGNGNSGTSAIIELNIMEECRRHAIFIEHNTENMIVRDNGVFKTRKHQENGQYLAAGIRCQAAGENSILHNAIVYNEGKGHYFKPHDCRGPNNQDVIQNNVYIQNARDTDIDIQRVEFLGGDEWCSNGSSWVQSIGREWNSSLVQGNVFYNDVAPNYFARDIQNSYSTTDSLGTFESSSWTDGVNNVIAASAGVVVADYTDRKEFWKTAGLSYASKGPRGLVHPEDIPEIGWVVPA